MSLFSNVTQAADTVLPDNPIVATLATTATAAVAVSLLWRALDPAPIGPRAILTPERDARRQRERAAMNMVSEAQGASPFPTEGGGRAPNAAVLEVPLDVIPRDLQGRSPYDIVGPDAITTAVNQFYSKVCADPELADLFRGVDMVRLKRHQALFIGQLWGGPVTFPLEHLSTAHQKYKISPERYWRVVGHLMVTLTHLEVPDWICVFTMTRLYQARNLVIAEERQPPSERAAVSGEIVD